MPIKILFLASNPIDTAQLRLDEEVRAIDERLRRSNYRDNFQLEQHWAVRIDDIQECILRHNPNIVHFVGHGNRSGEIILLDNQGNGKSVSVQALSDLFETLKDNIKCVVLNACYSEKQALAIAQHIDCVVGMSTPISDQSAISFSSSFYQALGYGKNIKTAFDLGCSQIALTGLGESSTPKLIALNQDPEKMIFHLSNVSVNSEQETKSQITIKRVDTNPPVELKTTEKLITIGRAPKNIIQINAPQISWEQGQILLVHGEYHYFHLSKNTPSIIRRKGEEYLLKVGLQEKIVLKNQDRILIGDSILIIEFNIANQDNGYITTAKQ
jgi:hypothetical protein